MLQNVAPTATRVAILLNPRNSSNAAIAINLQVAMQGVRVTGQPVEAATAEGEAADLAAREPPFDREVAPLDVTELVHAQRERAEAAAFERLGALRQRHKSHAPTALLLCEGARPRADRRECDRRNECASVHHSITILTYICSPIESGRCVASE